ncbi:hypothetical protein [Kitasatospora cinereorecta]|uniref:Transmembrane transport protein n=1 Tax=Kitasatospora cinereorecta TaxID=285560 RepID=A0ABW0VGS1_9ACTN
MIWVTWRQFRTQAVVGAVALGAVAIFLLLLGLRMRADYDANLAGCMAQGCAPGVVAGFEDTYATTVMVVDLGLIAVPGLLGAFWGAPLIGGELAAGTHRLAWQQSVTRTRWLAVKLLLVGLAATAVTGLLALLTAWAVSSYDTVRADRFAALAFGARGTVPMAYAAFAFVLGATSGLLLRRPVAALGATLAVFTACQFAVPTALRPHYIAPRTADIRLDAATLSHADGIVLNGSALTIGGVALPDAWVVSAGPAAAAAGREPDGDALAACLTPGQHARTMECLAEQNLHVTAHYQPSSRYWPFQLIETGLYAAMTAALAALCFARIRRTL